MMEKMKKYKNVGAGALAIITVLFICYLIGQNIVLPKRMKAEGLLTFDDKMPQYSFLQNAQEVFYENQFVKEDVPGGENIGLIQLEDSTKVFFMTPESALRSDMVLKKSPTRLSFVCGYHPMIEAGITNGALLTVEVISLENEEVILSEDVFIEDGEREKTVSIDLSDIREQNVRVRISCFCGENKDDNGDWIVVKYLAVE